MEAKSAAAREIALAFGVPPLLLGLPGDNTYANFAEANRALWRQTILPLVERTLAALVHWLEPAYGPGLRLQVDLDAIDALAPERDALWRRLEGASFLTDAEKRAQAGFRDAMKGGPGGKAARPFDRLASRGAKYSPDQPRDEQGRWTSGGGGGGPAGTGESPASVAATAIRGSLVSQGWHASGDAAWTLCQYTNDLAFVAPGHVECPPSMIGVPIKNPFAR